MGVKTIILTLIAVSAMFWALTGCSRLGNTAKTLKSKDGTVQIDLLADWVEATNLNSSACLQAKNSTTHEYIIAILDEKADLVDMTLEKIAKRKIDHLKLSTTEANVSEPTNITVNGCPGIQYEMHAIAKGTKIGYLLTEVETPHNYAQVLMWSTESHFVENRPTMDQVLLSFKENSPQ